MLNMFVPKIGNKTLTCLVVFLSLPQFMKAGSNNQQLIYRRIKAARIQIVRILFFTLCLTQASNAHSKKGYLNQTPYFCLIHETRVFSDATEHSCTRSFCCSYCLVCKYRRLSLFRSPCVTTTKLPIYLVSENEPQINLFRCLITHITSFFHTARESLPRVWLLI